MTFNGKPVEIDDLSDPATVSRLIAEAIKADDDEALEILREEQARNRNRATQERMMRFWLMTGMEE